MDCKMKILTANTLKLTVSIGKTYIATDQEAGLQATLQHSSERSHAFLQRIQECYERDFDRVPSKRCVSKSTGNYVCIDVSDGII